jgi:hypothetical protein
LQTCPTRFGNRRDFDQTWFYGNGDICGNITTLLRINGVASVADLGRLSLEQFNTSHAFSIRSTVSAATLDSPLNTRLTVSTETSAALATSWTVACIRNALLKNQPKR